MKYYAIVTSGLNTHQLKQFKRNRKKFKYGIALYFKDGQSRDTQYFKFKYAGKGYRLYVTQSPARSKYYMATLWGKDNHYRAYVEVKLK